MGKKGQVFEASAAASGWVNDWYVTHRAQERDVRMSIQRNQSVTGKPARIHFHADGQRCNKRCEVVVVG